MSFLHETFAEDGSKGSPVLNSSQVLMFLHAIMGSIWITVVVCHGKVLPDAVSMAGVTAFIATPYAISQLRGAVAAASNGTKPNGGQS